jgi:hypothetical protein
MSKYKERCQAHICNYYQEESAVITLGLFPFSYFFSFQRKSRRMQENPLTIKCISHSKNLPHWAQWLILVILVTWEAEIRRITVQSQSGPVQEVLSQKHPTQNRAG